MVLAATHFIVDGFGNILAPLLPLLILNLNLSLAAAGTLQMCFQLANSVAQLGFGHIADRWRPRLLLLAGPLHMRDDHADRTRAGSVTLALVLVLGGLGGAAFHPPAAALVHRFSGAQRGMAMSTHITSGTVGQAMAPLVFAPFVQQFGLTATPLLMIPALAVLSVLLRRIPAFDRLQEHHEAGGIAALRPYARPLTLLYLIVVLRTLTAMSFSTFVPVLLTRRGLSLAQAGTACRSISSPSVSADSSADPRPIVSGRGGSSSFPRVLRAVSDRRADASRLAFVVVLAIGDSCCNRRCRSTSRLRSSSRQSAQQRCPRS